jgi:16S rRNA (cytosine1402-N4)-methyltransferase
MAEEDSGGHTPVLLEAVNRWLDARPGETAVDVTVGLAGHARRLAQHLGASGTLIGLDVDPEALEAARAELADAACQIRLFHANFSELQAVLGMAGESTVDVLFADLGVSSAQLANPQRGLSFQLDGPLDMRLDPRLTVTAADLVNRLKERELSDLFYRNAQEFKAGRIARAICQSRRDRRITSTARLAEIVAGAVGVDPESRRERLHPATRVFLALRMAVNDEIAGLESLLRTAPEVLRPGGRFGVITFHSGEDKPVKLDFRRRKSEGVYRMVTRKPVVADEEERRANPRSRSAKLRVVARLGAGEHRDDIEEELDDDSKG